MHQKNKLLLKTEANHNSEIIVWFEFGVKIGKYFEGENLTHYSSHISKSSLNSLLENDT